MKHTLNTLSIEVESLKGQIDKRDDQIRKMQEDMDQMKDAMDQFLLTTNSAYKKRKALDDVGDFLNRRWKNVNS